MGIDWTSDSSLANKNLHNIDKNSPFFYRIMDSFRNDFISTGFIRISFDPKNRDRAIMMALFHLTHEDQPVRNTRLITPMLDPLCPFPSQAVIHYQWKEVQRTDLHRTIST